MKSKPGDTGREHRHKDVPWAETQTRENLTKPSFLESSSERLTGWTEARLRRQQQGVGLTQVPVARLGWARLSRAESD